MSGVYDKGVPVSRTLTATGSKGILVSTMLIVRTANLRYTGPDRLDITRTSGSVFAPSHAILRPMKAGDRRGEPRGPRWPPYEALYIGEMRVSYREHRAAWEELLARPSVTLVCFCAERDLPCCHRVTLAGLLVKCGARYDGEVRLRTREETAGHHCHARGCKTKVPPEMLMCGKHWRAVPRALQLEVWKHYRKGQCDDMEVTTEYLNAADAAIRAVALAEGK